MEKRQQYVFYNEINVIINEFKNIICDLVKLDDKNEYKYKKEDKMKKQLLFICIIVLGLTGCEKKNYRSIYYYL